MYKFLKKFIKNIKTSMWNGKILDEYRAHFLSKRDEEIAKFISKYTKYMYERFPQTMEFIGNNEKQETAGIVSKNAQNGIGEFIAETYERMIIAYTQKKGKPIPKNVDKLYQEYNGPTLAN